VFRRPSPALERSPAPDARYPSPMLKIVVRWLLLAAALLLVANIYSGVVVTSFDVGADRGPRARPASTRCCGRSSCC
jgi:hypothetical protein